MIIFNLILIFILFVFILLCFVFLMTPLFSKVPFVPVRKKVLSEIISALELKDKSVLYDLGCGDGRVLFAASEVYKNITCVGIEKAPFPYLWAKYCQFFAGDKRVSILYGDMFKLDISPATHIFLYLFPRLMNDLLPKFEKELKPGSRVVSCDFEFANKKPIKIIDLKSKKRQLNHRLLVYEF